MPSIALNSQERGNLVPKCKDDMPNNLKANVLAYISPNVRHLQSLISYTCHPFSSAYHLSNIQYIPYLCGIFHTNYICSDLQVCPWPNIQREAV